MISLSVQFASHFNFPRIGRSILPFSLYIYLFLFFSLQLLFGEEINLVTLSGREELECLKR